MQIRIKYWQFKANTNQIWGCAFIWLYLLYLFVTLDAPLPPAPTATAAPAWTTLPPTCLLPYEGAAWISLLRQWSWHRSLNRRGPAHPCPSKYPVSCGSYTKVVYVRYSCTYSCVSCAALTELVTNVQHFLFTQQLTSCVRLSLFFFLLRGFFLVSLSFLSFDDLDVDSPICTRDPWSCRERARPHPCLHLA